MQQIIRNLFLTLPVLLLSLQVWAQSGNIKGSIVDKSAQALPGAVISIEQTHIRNVSGMDGSFELLQVPAGRHKLTVTYMGYSNYTIEVEVKEKETSNTGKLTLTESDNMMREVVVKSGLRKGSESKAINMTRMSNKVITVLSAEGISKLPDRNAADALQRVAGVAVQKNKGEGNYVSIRGTPKDWAATLLNGDRLPVADEDNTSRSFDFEIVPASLLDYLIVTRTVTPDMEGDNIGGAVNIITQSVVTERTLKVDIGGGLNTLANKPMGSLNFVWGDVSKNKKFSYIVDGSYYARNYAADATVVAYGTPYNHSLARLELKDYTGMRTTKSFNVGTDYKFNDRFKIGAKFIYSQMLDDKYQQKMSYNWDDGSGARIRLQNIHGVLNRQLYGGEFNTEYKVNDRFKLDGKVAAYYNQFTYGPVPFSGNDARNGYTTTEFVSPLLQFTDMTNTDFFGQALKPDATTSYPYKLLGIDNPYGTGGDNYKNIQPRYTQMPDPLHPDQDLNKPVTPDQYYLSGAFADLNKTVERDPVVAQLNGHYKIGNNVTLSAGVKYRHKEGERNISYYQWNLTPGLRKIPLTEFATEPMARQNEFLSAWGSPYSGTLMPALTRDQMNSFMGQYGDSLVGLPMDTNNSQYRNWVGSHYKYTEDVSAGYVMAEATINSRLSLVGGVRVEKTTLHETSDTLMYSSDPLSQSGLTSRAVSVDRNYLAILPTINATYALSGSSNLRMAVSRTFHRPNFEETKPGSALFERENYFFILGNPNLRPTFSINTDLMFEHYWGNKGMFSIGGYYKNVTDHIFEAASPVEDPAYAGFVQKTFLNAKKAYVLGVEIVLNRKFDFLPGFWKRFGVNTNLTYSYSQMDVPGRPKRQAMTEQAPLLYNVSLYYEHHRINTRLAFNYTSAYSYALNLFTDITTNELVHKDTDYDYFMGNAYSLDYQFLFRFSEHFSAYGEVNNLLNAPYHTYVGRSDRPGRTEFYKQRVMVGVNSSYKNSSTLKQTIMKKISVFTMVLMALIVNMAQASQKRKVMIIGMDGVRSDALQAAATPNIDALIATGFYTYDSWHCGITVSGPSWSTIFTGVWFPKHGVTDNSYAGSHFDMYPYYAKRVKEVKPGLFAAQVVDWAPMSTSVINDGFDTKVVRSEGDCAAVAAAAQTQLLNPNLDAITVYFAKVDDIGHASGFSPSNPAYMNAIHEVDSFVGKVIATLKARPTYADEDWLILITTDHGGTGTTHGGNSDAERHIWWIASGTDVVSRQITAADPGSYNMTSNPVNPALLKLAPVQADIAVTAMHHLMYDASDLTLRPENKTAWNLDGKSWLDSIKHVAPVGIIDPATQELNVKIFPNPSTGLVTFWFETQNQPVSYAVYNQSGQLVKNEEQLSMVNKLNIDLADQANGIYFIKVSCGTTATTKKIILNK